VQDPTAEEDFKKVQRKKDSTPCHSTLRIGTMKANRALGRAGGGRGARELSGQREQSSSVVKKKPKRGDWQA